MKTTLDLPDDLVKALKLRAVREGKKLKEAVAETLRAGLASARVRKNGRAAQRVPKTLPLIKSGRVKRAAGKRMGPQQFSDFIKDAELEHEAGRHESTLGHQHVDRPDR